VAVKQSGVNTVFSGKVASAVITTASPNLHWSLESTPIPIFEYSDLDKQQVRLRQRIKLVSQLQSKVDFVVGMRFVAAAPENAGLLPFRTTSADGFSRNDAGRKMSVLFRTHNGLLAAGDINTDGNVLAVLENGHETQILACEARSIHKGAREIFSSSRPVKVVLNTAVGGEELRVVATTLAALRIATRGNPTGVLLDGHPLPFELSGGLLLLQVTEGEHSVSIRY